MNYDNSIGEKIHSSLVSKLDSKDASGILRDFEVSLHNQNLTREQLILSLEWIQDERGNSGSNFKSKKIAPYLEQRNYYLHPNRSPFKLLIEKGNSELAFLNTSFLLFISSLTNISTKTTLSYFLARIKPSLIEQKLPIDHLGKNRHLVLIALASIGITNKLSSKDVLQFYEETNTLSKVNTSSYKEILTPVALNSLLHRESNEFLNDHANILDLEIEKINKIWLSKVIEDNGFKTVDTKVSIFRSTDILTDSLLDTCIGSEIAGYIFNEELRRLTLSPDKFIKEAPKYFNRALEMLLVRNFNSIELFKEKLILTLETAPNYKTFEDLKLNKDFKDLCFYYSIAYTSFWVAIHLYYDYTLLPDNYYIKAQEKDSDLKLPLSKEAFNHLYGLTQLNELVDEESLKLITDRLVNTRF